MSAEFFLDTNVFVYAVDSADRGKQAVAQKLVVDALAGNAVTSSQVAQEFMNVVLKQAAQPLEVADVRRLLDTMILPLVEVWPGAELYHRALDVRTRWGFSFYDSLIVAAALKSGARVLLTEDLQHGQLLDGLKVQNPFLSTS